MKDTRALEIAAEKYEAALNQLIQTDPADTRTIKELMAKMVEASLAQRKALGLSTI
jgi:hypothetical protein